MPACNLFNTMVTSTWWKNFTFLWLGCWMGPSAGFWLLWRGKKSLTLTHCLYSPQLGLHTDMKSMWEKKFVFQKWSYVGQLILIVSVTDQFQLLLVSEVMNDSDILHLKVTKLEYDITDTLVSVYPLLRFEIIIVHLKL